ncbi:MAG: hypothetical protein BGO98_15840 [Myxococcales bacterium 68-20]|nr:MAG: hypothetical protein BGO98_15840 [Myxococcales bacterium 68-20]
MDAVRPNTDEAQAERAHAFVVAVALEQGTRDTRRAPRPIRPTTRRFPLQRRAAGCTEDDRLPSKEAPA